jgi:GxxExxY protein
MEQHDTEYSERSDRHGETSNDVKGGREPLLYHDLTETIIGACYSAHSQLGSGFLEAVYANAVAVLLRGAGLKVGREVPFDIHFHGHLIGRYRADLIVESKVIVEVKCVQAIGNTHLAQVRNYLRASGLRVGLVFNFRSSAEVKRVIA